MAGGARRRVSGLAPLGLVCAEDAVHDAGRLGRVLRARLGHSRAERGRDDASRSQHAKRRPKKGLLSRGCFAWNHVHSLRPYCTRLPEFAFSWTFALFFCVAVTSKLP